MVFVGVVCFVLGANLGLVTAALLNAARHGELPPKDEKRTHWK